MIIKNVSNLICDKMYWYIGVRYACHWEIYVKHDTYKQGHDWSKMIVFDNEQQAQSFKRCLQNCVNKFIIRS